MLSKVEIGKRLRSLRGKQSQAEMAEKVGVTSSAWAMYERGERIPRDEIKEKIAKTCNSTVEKIFFR